MILFPLLTALVVLFCGLYALHQNPRRPTNLILSIVCFLHFLAQSFQLVARIVGERYWADHTSNPLPWVRLRFSIIGLLCPLMVWACYYVVSGRYTGRRDLVRKLAPWGAISLFLSSVPFFEAFKPSNSRPDRILNGPLFTVYLGVIFTCLVAVCVASLRIAPRLRGIQRLEFRFITLPFGYLALAAIAATLFNLIFPQLHWIEEIVKILSFLVFFVFGISAWSVTTRRIYHSSDVFLPWLERFFAVTLVALPATYLLHWLPKFDPTPWSAAGIIGLACIGFLFIDDKLRALLNLKSEHRTNAAASELKSAAATELNPDRLSIRFEAILSRFSDGVRVRICASEQNGFLGNGLEFTLSELEATSIREEGWLSVASLGRAKHSAIPAGIYSQMRREGVHLLVSPPLGESEASLVVAFGERENGVPFTHPEILALRQLAEIANGLYARCRFSLQARQAEQLATIGLVGAGLAHELRSPIAAINTFAQLLPSRLRDERFLLDFSEVIPGEAKRIETLAEQLLDLSKPRHYEFAVVDVGTVIADTVTLMKQHADDAHITLSVHRPVGGQSIRADPQALRQVLLNLVLNAIQSIASAGRKGDVTIRTSGGGSNVEIEVADDGPGIPDHIRHRLFRPFASAGKDRGLGLGLAICLEIMRVHRGTISADNRPEGGAIFRLAVPVAPKDFSTQLS